MGTQPFIQKGAESHPIFGPRLLWQMAVWMKMPFGMEVAVGLCNIVFDVDSATPRKKAHPPPSNFGSCLLWPNGWMDEDAA